MPDIPAAIAEIEREHPMQRRIWTVSRLAWWGMGAVLALAGLGLFGDGPLAGREVRAGEVRLTYDRFQRADATTAVEIALPAGMAREVPLCLDRAFLDEWRLVRAEPAAAREEAGPDGVCLALLRGEGAGDAPLRLRLWVQPRLPRLSAEGHLRVAGGPPLPLAAVVFP